MNSNTLNSTILCINIRVLLILRMQPYTPSFCIKEKPLQGEKSSEDFWTKAERLLYCALIGYIWYEAPEEEQNFATLLEFINASETREDDETFKNAVDMLFEELEKEEPEHFAVRQYKKYKLAAGKTAKSILISCGARLAPFDIAELREIMSYDEMELDMVGDQRTALFIIISDTDDTFNFVVAMMYSQLFNHFGCSSEDVVLLHRVKYCGNWDVLRPAKIVEGMGLISENLLEKLNNEAHI